MWWKWEHWGTDNCKSWTRKASEGDVFVDLTGFWIDQSRWLDNSTWGRHFAGMSFWTAVLYLRLYSYPSFFTLEPAFGNLTIPSGLRWRLASLLFFYSAKCNYILKDYHWVRALLLSNPATATRKKLEQKADLSGSFTLHREPPPHCSSSPFQSIKAKEFHGSQIIL